MDYHIFFQWGFPGESFAASVVLKTPLPSVRLRVALQLARRRASIIALVTLEWLFSCVVPYHVSFQLTGCNEGRLAHCASVRLFPRVGFFCDPSDCLIELQHNRIGCTAVASLQCVS